MSHRAEVADAISQAPLVIDGLTILPDKENAYAFEITPAGAVTLTVEPTEPGAGTSVTAASRVRLRSIGAG